MLPSTLPVTGQVFCSAINVLSSSCRGRLRHGGQLTFEGFHFRKRNMDSDRGIHSRAKHVAWIRQLDADPVSARGGFDVRMDQNYLSRNRLVGERLGGDLDGLAGLQ